MPRKILRCEQETIISRTEDEDGWNVYTCSTVFKRRIVKFAARHSIPVRNVDRDGIELTLPADWLRFFPPRRVSDAQRASSAASLGAARAARALREAEPVEASIAETSHESQHKRCNISQPCLSIA